MKPTDPPPTRCWICDVIVVHDAAHYDSRFNIGFCDRHASVPPAYGDRARQQFKTTGKTQWDK